MIEYVDGDLLLSDSPIIAHGCNAQGVMGSGVAKAIRDRYSEVFEAYRKHYDTNGKLDLGEVIWVRVSDTQIIANCITQSNYGKDGRRYVNYGAIAKCFQHIKEACIANNIDEIAIPQIGSGLGGGDWLVIKEIIEYIMDEVKVKVYRL